MRPAPTELLADRQWVDSVRGGLGLETIEAWPAAGGGLLVGVAEPVLAGPAPLRRRVKTIFIRIDQGGLAAVTIPYVSLEVEARCCAQVLVAEEFCIAEGNVELNAPRDGPCTIIDLGTNAERGLQACAATARTLLVAAAAELWGQSQGQCRAAEGIVHGTTQSMPCGSLAADAAALCDLPRAVRLRCGRKVRLSPPLPASWRVHSPTAITPNSASAMLQSPKVAI